MIYSVGIDLIDAERIQNAMDRYGNRFILKILGDDEFQMFNNKVNKCQFLAGRFAAKEAVIKTLGAFFERKIRFRDLQVLNDLYGKPYVHLEDNIRERLMDKEVKISITHEKKMAAAVAVITGE